MTEFDSTFAPDWVNRAFLAITEGHNSDFQGPLSWQYEPEDRVLEIGFLPVEFVGGRHDGQVCSGSAGSFLLDLSKLLDVFDSQPMLLVCNEKTTLEGEIKGDHAVISIVSDLPDSCVGMKIHVTEGGVREELIGDEGGEQ